MYIKELRKAASLASSVDLVSAGLSHFFFLCVFF